MLPNTQVTSPLHYLASFYVSLLPNVPHHPLNTSWCPFIIASQKKKSFDVPQHHLTILPWHVVFPSSPLSPKLVPHYFWTYTWHLQTLKKLAKPKIYQGHSSDPKDIPKKKDVGNLGHDISFVGVFSIYMCWVTNFVVYMMTFFFSKVSFTRQLVVMFLLLILFLCVGIAMSPLLVFFLFVGIGCSPLLSTF